MNTPQLPRRLSVMETFSAARFRPWKHLCVAVVALAPWLSIAQAGLDVGRVRVPFAENQGQLADDVVYSAPTFAGAVSVLRDGALRLDGTGTREIIGTGDFSSGQEAAETKISYFVGNDSSKWLSGVPTWNSVGLGERFPGVAVELRAYGKNVEKIFTVAAGVDPSIIRVGVDGVQALSVDESGQLVASTDSGDVEYTAPIAYQDIDGQRVDIPVAYQVAGTTYGFEVGRYDASQPLVIDPLLASTCLGGSSSDYISALAVATNGEVYVVGMTTSTNFPIKSPAYWTNAASGAFVARFDNGLTNLMNLTHLSSMGSGAGHRILLATNGDVVISGYTIGTNFPVTAGAFQIAGRRFVTRLGKSLTNLVASTKLGDAEVPGDIAWQTNGDLVVYSRFDGGSSLTSITAYAAAYSRTNRGMNSYLLRVSGNLSNFVAGTFLGGSAVDTPTRMTVATNGRVWVTGYTTSTNFPTTANAYDRTFNPQPINSQSDMFIASFDPLFTNLLAATLLGGSNQAGWVSSTVGRDVAVAKNGDILALGDSYATNFPTTSGAYNTNFNKGQTPGSGYTDVVIVRMDSQLTNLVASTLLGGNRGDTGEAMAITTNDSVYVLNLVQDAYYYYPTTPYAFCTNWSNSSGDKGFAISHLDGSLSNLLASTFVSQTVVIPYPIPTDLQVASNGVWFTGQPAQPIGSPLIPTLPNAYQTNYAGGIDPTVARLDLNLSGPNMTLSGPAGWLELDTGTVSLVYTVSLNQVAFNPSFTRPSVSFSYRTVDGSAVGGEDFVATNGTVFFDVGAVSTTFVVQVTGDELFESNETFSVELYDVRSAWPLVTNLTCTITNDEVLLVSVLGRAMSEGDSGTTNFFFDVALNYTSAIPVSVNYWTSNSLINVSGNEATPGVDYAPTSGVVTIPAGMIIASNPVVVYGDTVYEKAEWIYVTISNAPVWATIWRGTNPLQINNDDAKPLISINDVAANEGNSGTSNFTFAVSLSVTSGVDTAFGYTNVYGTATTNDLAPTGGVRTITAGTLSTTVVVRVNGDTTYESNQTFFVNLNSFPDADPGDTNGLGTIVNDDAPPTCQWQAATFTGSESTRYGDILCQLSALSEIPVTAGFAFSNYPSASATLDVDMSITNYTLVVPPLALTGSSRIIVSNDAVYEGYESCYLILTNLDNAGFGVRTTCTFQIQDDEPVPTLSIDSVSAAEGNSGLSNFTFTVTRTQASVIEAGCTFRTVNGTATVGVDYVSTTGTVVLPPGVTSTAITVQVVGDTVYEPDETFFVQIAGIYGASAGTTNGIGTILNDDTVKMNIGDVSAAEGNSGTSNFSFRIYLDAVQGFQTAVRYATVDGTATGGVDYVSTNGLLLIPAGTLSTTIVVQVLGDTVVESNETFTLALTNAFGFPLGKSNGVGTILNDDAALIYVSVNDVTNYEGNSGLTDFVFTASLSEAATSTVSFTVSSVSGGTSTYGEDVSGGGAYCSMPPGQVSTTVTIQVYGDLLIEPDETFFVQIANLTGVLPGDTNGVGTILNDDVLPALYIGGTTNFEGNSGTTPFDFPVWIVPAFTADVSCTFTTLDGTATLADNDYVTTNGSLTFPAGMTQAVIRVNGVGDTFFEMKESFGVQLGDIVGAVGAVTNAVGIIRPDDGPILSIDTVSNYEGNSGTSNFTFTVSLSQASTGTVTFSYGTASAPAYPRADAWNGYSGDYYSTNGSLSILAGTLSTTVVVRVVGDTQAESDEPFFVNVSNIVGAADDVTTGQGWILDDDSPVVFVNDVSGLEGNAGTSNFTFTLTRTGNVASVYSFVSYMTVDGTAVAGQDYVGVNNYLQFGMGQTSATVTVQVNGDLAYEGDETFFLQLTYLSQARPGRTNGVGTILEDGDVPADPTLTVTSSHGTPLPAGTTTNPSGTVLTNRVSSPDMAGTTQYVCTGWTMTGNAPLSGSTNEFSMTLTNDAVLSWLWTTNVDLTWTAQTGGTIPAGTNGWVALGAVASATATPDSGYVFTGWSGDTQGDTNAATLTVTMDRARALTAHFLTNSAMPPTVGPVTLIRATNQLLKAPLTQLMTNSFNLGGGGLTVSWVAPLSTNGYPVATQGVWVVYRPATNDNRTDYFSFRLRNIYGLEAEGICQVIIPLVADGGRPTLNISAITSDAGNAQVRFVGIPARPYDVQGATLLSPANWSNIGAVVIGPQGFVVYIETNPPPQRYYRTVVPTP